MAGVTADAVIVEIQSKFDQYERNFDSLIRKTETGMAKLRRLTEKPVTVGGPKSGSARGTSQIEKDAQKTAQIVAREAAKTAALKERLAAREAANQERINQRKIASEEKAAQRAQAVAERAAQAAERAANRKAEAEERAAQRATAAAEKAAAKQAEVAARAQAKADAAAARAKAAQERIAAAVERAANRSGGIVSAGGNLGGVSGSRSAVARQTASMRAGTALGGSGSMVAPVDRTNYFLRDQIDTQVRFNAAQAAGNRAEAQALRDQLTQFRLINQYKRAGLDETEATARAEQRVAEIQRQRARRPYAGPAARQAGQGGGAINGAVGGIGRLAAGALAGYGAFQGAREYLELTDAYKQYTAQLRLATAENGNFAQAQQDVSRVASETRTGIAETAQLYAVFQRNADQLGLTQEQSARATETVSKTFQISGATAAEAAGGLRQFLQALQSGTLRGEEFNSVVENAPRLAKLLADQLTGGNIGALRALASEGKITGDQLKEALTNQQFTAQIDEEFKQLPVTFDQSMTLVKNAATETFGEFDRGGGFSEAIAAFFAQSAEGFGGMQKDAGDTGILIRSTFEALNDVFQPLRANAASVFDQIGGDSRSVAQQIRDDISGILKAYDAVRNVGVSIDNGVSKIPSFFGSGTPRQYFDTAGQFNRRQQDIASQRQNQRVAQNIDNRFGGMRSLGAFVRGERSIFGQNLRAPAPRVNADVKKYQDLNADLEKLKAGANAKELKTINQKISKNNQIIDNLNKGVSVQAARAAVPSAGRGRRGPSAETLAKREEAERLRGVRKEDAYNSEVERLNGAILSAKGKQAQSIDSSYEAAVANADADLKQSEIKYQNQLNEGKITDEQRKVLVGLAGQVRAQEVLTANTERAAALASDALQRQADAANNQADAIRAQLDVTVSRTQREKLQNQLIEKEYEARRAALLERYQGAAPGSAESLNIEGQIANLPEQQAAEQFRNRQDNRGSYQRYRESLTGVDSLSEDIDNIKVDVLDRVADSLATATTNALGLTGALGDVVGQIIKIGIQRRLIGPLADGLFGKADGSTAGSIGRLLGSILGGARASGGDVSAGKLYRINENGPEYFQPAMSGKIIPTGRASEAGARGVTVVAPQHYDLSGVVMTEDLVRALRADNRRYADTVAAQAGNVAVNSSPARYNKFQQLGS